MCNSFAQTETTTYKTIADKFELNYNNENYDSIFLMFDAVMQKALPPEKTKELHIIQVKSRERIIVFINALV